MAAANNFHLIMWNLTIGPTIGVYPDDLPENIEKQPVVNSQLESET